MERCLACEAERGRQPKAAQGLKPRFNTAQYSNTPSPRVPGFEDEDDDENEYEAHLPHTNEIPMSRSKTLIP